MAQDSSSSLAETLESSLCINSADDQSHPSSSSAASDPSLSRNVSFSRLNARAPEFVPTRPQTTGAIAVRSDLQQHPRLVIPPPQALVHVYPSPNSPFHPHVPVQNHHVVPVQYHHPHHHPHHDHHHPHYGGGRGEQDGVSQQQQGTDHDRHDRGTSASKNALSEEATHKLLNQVEYYFSDINLATTDHLMRFINKDPEGYVPISVVASFKKIKALISSNSQLASVLRRSTKLAVSEDGKKVKRQHPLTESDMEELQSRIVVAENLPEDHCHQNLLKVFSTVGSVKTIRTCQPQNSNSGPSASRSAKADGLLYCNKLHAFVEYESVELAEKAVAELNDEGNWRSGLRVRLFHRRTAKPAQIRGRKVGHEDEGNCEEEGTSTSEQQLNDRHMEESSQLPDVCPQDHAEQGEVAMVANLMDPDYKLELSSLVPSVGLPRATIRFPLGEISLEEKEEEEVKRTLSLNGIFKGQMLNGVCTAQYRDEVLNLRYCYKDEQMSFIPSITLPSNALSFAFKRRFSPSDKWSYWYNLDTNYWSTVYKHTVGKDLKFKAGYDSEVRLGWASLWIGDENGKAKTAPLKMKVQFMLQVPQDDIKSSALMFRVKKRWDI